MATLEEAIYTKLSTTVALTALVSTRIYPVLVPQNAVFPHLCFSRVSATRPSAFGSDPGIVFSRISFDIFANQFDDALAINTQLRLALKRYRAVTPVKIFDTFMLNEVQLFDDEQQIHHFVADYEFSYLEV